MQEVVLFYNGLDVPTRQILNSRGAIPSKTAADANVAIQEMAKYSQKWHNGTSRTRSTKTSDGLAAIQAQLNNLGREIKKVNEKLYAAQVGCEQCKGPHYTKDCPLKEEEKTLEEAYYTQFGAPFQGGGYRATTSGASVNVMPLSTYLNLGLGELAHTKLTVELADRTVKYPKGIAKNVLVGIVGEERIIFKSVKPASSLIKRFYILSLRERMELDLEARLMRETLVLNRSLDPLNRDYIELNNLNVPIELRRDQVDDLMPTIEEDEVVKEFRARNDARMVSEIFGYPSDYDHDKKIRIDYAYNLKFSCMIDYKGNNVVGALMNVPIFVGTFSVKTDFAVLEDMDDYRDEGMGDVIFGELFLREVIIKARRFNGMITIYNGNDEVTYEMVRSHPRVCKVCDDWEVDRYRNANLGSASKGSKQTKEVDHKESGDIGKVKEAASGSRETDK
ncbi:integrase, catalytic region, zinc finger, CCHC-type containing protein [Tanacetum coccineum]